MNSPTPSTNTVWHWVLPEWQALHSAFSLHHLICPQQPREAGTDHSQFTLEEQSQPLTKPGFKHRSIRLPSVSAPGSPLQVPHYRSGLTLIVSNLNHRIFANSAARHRCAAFTKGLAWSKGTREIHLLLLPTPDILRLLPSRKGSRRVSHPGAI